MDSMYFYNRYYFFIVKLDIILPMSTHRVFGKPNIMYLWPIRSIIVQDKLISLIQGLRTFLSLYFETITFYATTTFVSVHIQTIFYKSEKQFGIICYKFRWCGCLPICASRQPNRHKDERKKNEISHFEPSNVFNLHILNLLYLFRDAKVRKKIESTKFFCGKM